MVVSALVSVLLPFLCALGTISVHDGDTFRGKDCVNRRLWGGDVVELDQTCDGEPCGLWARGALVEILSKGEVICDDRGESHGRVVSRCFVNGVDVTRQMVRLGWGIDVPRYSDGEYADEEREAKRARRGMWAFSDVMTPFKWRASHGTGYKRW